ncbi:hypothetical protein EV2_008568 [Malus domestica]
MAMRLAAAAHPVRSGLNEAVKGVVKGDVCYFKTNARLDYLLVESQTHLLEMKYITEMIERVAKYSGCPPPPRPPASSSKEEASAMVADQKSMVAEQTMAEQKAMVAETEGSAGTCRFFLLSIDCHYPYLSCAKNQKSC